MYLFRSKTVLVLYGVHINKSHRFVMSFYWIFLIKLWRIYIVLNGFLNFLIIINNEEK